MIISVTFCLGYSDSVLIGAGIWYQTNPVPDLHDVYIYVPETGAGKMELIYDTGSFWSVCHGYKYRVTTPTCKVLKTSALPHALCHACHW